MTAMSLRASDHDRDQVVELLNAAYAEGRIRLEELQERTAAAVRSRTFDELSALTVDLVPTPRASVPQHASIPPYDEPGAPATQPDLVRAILTETKRVGAWRVRRKINANAMVGSVLLDLTEATFEAPVVEIDCSVLLGEVKIRVRPGTTVRMEAGGIIGDSSVRGLGPVDPSLPTVVVTGTAVLGEITVRGPKKPPFWRRRVA